MIAHRGAGNVDKAVEIGRKATATPSAKPTDDAQIWNIYAQVLQDAKLYDEALAALDKTLALDPTTPQVPARKAGILISADRYQEAVDVVKAAIEAALPKAFKLEPRSISTVPIRSPLSLPASRAPRISKLPMLIRRPPPQPSSALSSINP